MLKYLSESSLALKSWTVVAKSSIDSLFKRERERERKKRKKKETIHLTYVVTTCMLHSLFVFIFLKKTRHMERVSYKVGDLAFGKEARITLKKLWATAGWGVGTQFMTNAPPLFHVSHPPVIVPHTLDKNLDITCGLWSYLIDRSYVSRSTARVACLMAFLQFYPLSCTNALCPSHLFARTF